MVQVTTIRKRFVSTDTIGIPVNSKNPGSFEYARYNAAPKGIGPRFGKTLNPKRAKFPTRRRRR